jgi:hypothetical protein
MESNTRVVSWAVIVMAACSLFSMIGTLRIDEIINHDLYQYGLQFSYAWATPYWITAGFVFAMGWLNLIMATLIHAHALALRRKSSKQVVSQAEKETTRTKKIEKSEEEKPTPTAEAQEQPIEMQVRVRACFIETNVQERKGVSQTVVEETTVLEHTQSPQSGQGEELEVRELGSSEETVTEQEESGTEGCWTTAEEEQNLNERTLEQVKGGSEQSEETIKQENEEAASPAGPTTHQEGTKREQLRESEETQSSRSIC